MKSSNQLKLEVEAALAASQSPAPIAHDDTVVEATYVGHQRYSAPAQPVIFDGEKFPGGFGVTQLLTADYWTLRARSAELFDNNLYARGLIRRLVTNEINTGLSPEATPFTAMLGKGDGDLNDWSEMVESRFAVWGKNKEVCDFKGHHTFGGLQALARSEALIEGDVLVVMRQSKVYGTPQVQIFKGGAITNPMGGAPHKGNEIKHGVEVDPRGRHVAFWVRQADGTHKRLPAFGERSGKRLAWMVYGSDKRLDAVRGQPLLSILLQSLKEIDRYRDSAQRKAVINSILAMFIKKTEDKPGTLPMSNGAVRKDTVVVSDSDGTPRNYGIANQVPGIVMEELQMGEEPVGFHSQGTDVNFGTFEESIIQAVAWANEIPPEILTLAFSNNYSASQAAINEFKIYINKVWSEFGDSFCGPVYTEWLISEIMSGKIMAPGFVMAWNDPKAYDVYGAWVAADWYGSIKPSTDMVKQGKASKQLIEMGLSTHAREARVTTGTKFSRNIPRLKAENQMLADAMRPLAEFKREFGEQLPDEAQEALDAKMEALIEGAIGELQGVGE